MPDTDEEQGTLRVNINYIKAAHHINGAIHFLQLFSKDLEEAALKMKIKKLKDPHKGNNGEWP